MRATFVSHLRQIAIILAVSVLSAAVRGEPTHWPSASGWTTDQKTRVLGTPSPPAIEDDDRANATRLSGFTEKELQWVGDLVRLGDDWFLAQDTRFELWVWRAGSTSERKITRWPAQVNAGKPVLFPLSAPFYDGTLIATRNGNPFGENYLIHWSRTKADFVASLGLGRDFWVKSIVPLTTNRALVCGVVDGSGNETTDATRFKDAFVVEYAEREIRRSTAEGYVLRPSLDASNVRGPVSGVGWVSDRKLAFVAKNDETILRALSSKIALRNNIKGRPEPARPMSAYRADDTPEMRNLLGSLGIRTEPGHESSDLPIAYNTEKCAWELIRSLPGEYGEQPAEVTPHWLSTGELVIRDARWPRGGNLGWPRRLLNPFIWNAADSRWDSLPAPVGRLSPDALLGNVWPGDPLVNVFRSNDTIERFDQDTKTWHPLPLPAYIRNRGGYAPIRLMPLSDQSYLIAQSGERLMRLKQDTQPEPFRPVYGFDRAVQRADGGFLLFGWDSLPNLSIWSKESYGEYRFQWYPPGATIPQLMPLPPRSLRSAEPLSLKDGSFLFLAPMPYGCSVTSGCNENIPPEPALRLVPEEGRWEVLDALAVPAIVNGANLRADQGAIVRGNGDIVWLVRDGTPPYPVKTTLMRWNAGAGFPSAVAQMVRGRAYVTLADILEKDKDDRSLLAIGGIGQPELIATERSCLSCPETFVSLGEPVSARSTERLDEKASPVVWRSGKRLSLKGVSLASARLTNGRIFQLVEDDREYRGAIVDPIGGSQQLLPVVDFDQTNCAKDGQYCQNALGRRVEYPYAKTRLDVVGNRVFLIPDTRIVSRPLVFWDDDRSSWFAYHWRSDAGAPKAVLADRSERVLVLYDREIESYNPLAATPIQDQSIETVPDGALTSKDSLDASVASLALLRFDGVYQSKSQDSGWTYLRFFPNGTVIYVHSIGSPDEIRGWFKPGLDGVDTGRFEVNGKQIRIEISPDSDSLRYRGVLEGNRINLSWEYGPNGLHGTEVFSLSLD